MTNDEEVQSEVADVLSQLRKPQSLQRKIARALSVHFEYPKYMDADDIEVSEKSVAKVVKRVINAHNKGK